MKRIIGDKLNFLMLLTETKNNILGKAISFDPSYISRIRTGARGVPKHRDFIYPAAAFFAQAVQTKEQKEKLAEVICPGSGWPKDVNSAISLIANWLKQDLSIGSSFRNHTDDTPRSNHTESTAASTSPDTQTGFYYGNAGKRKCVIQFLTELSALNEPVKLLLHSEEDMLWMYEDPDFFENWSVLMRAILQNGSRIVIVHTVRRTLRELLEAVAKWSPLYATGLIESYYCPRLRDNIFKRTLLIGSGKAAIVGQTTGGNRKKPAEHVRARSARGKCSGKRILRLPFPVPPAYESLQRIQLHADCTCPFPLPWFRKQDGAVSRHAFLAFHAGKRSQKPFTSRRL